MADIWDSWFGTEGYQPGGMIDSSWTFSMPQAGDLLRWNPNQTNAALSQLFDLGDIGRAATSPAMSAIPNLISNPRNNPLMAGLYGKEGPPNPAGTGPSTPWWRASGSRALDLVRQNPAAVLALLGAGGAGIAGAIKGSERAKLPGQVQDLARRATAPAGPDPYAEAELDRQMRRDLGPGWETSTPGIQAKQYAAHLRQQGDRSAAQAGLGTVGQLYALQNANKSQEEQALWNLAATLGVLGLGGLGAFGGLGYTR